MTNVIAIHKSRLFLQSHRTGPVPNGRGLRDLCLMGVALVLLGLYCACSHISSKKSKQKRYGA